jgi:hypothetical protein
MAIRTLRKIERGEPLGQGEAGIADAFGLVFISADPALRERAGGKPTTLVQSPADPAIRQPAGSQPSSRPSGRAVATSWSSSTRNKVQSKEQSKDRRGNLLKANIGKKTLIGA